MERQTPMTMSGSQRGRVPVPFVDLGPTTSRVKAEILAGLDALIDTNGFVNGPEVTAFERAFADYVGTEHCVGLASGLDALRFALLAANIAEGDQVIVPAMTFIATFEAVTQAGGVPLVVDVSERDYGLDPAAVEAVIVEQTRFLLPVHLYGQMADMRALNVLAERHSLMIVEDACQAHGAERDGLRAGAAGDAAAFSFYPSKNLGAMGDAGAFVTDHGNLAATVRALRQHGETVKYRSDLLGYTSRLDTIQALVLLHKLPLLQEWNAQRASAAAIYTAELSGVGDLRLPPVGDASSPVWHLYVIRTRDPVGLADFLADQGIATARHYPEAPHLSRAYAYLGLREGAFPVAEAIAREGLSLPLFPGISEGQLTRVCDAIKWFFQRG